MASEWISERNRVILVQAAEAAPLPPDRELRALFERVQKEEIPPYVDTVADGPLVATLPRPGRVRRERQIAEVGVTEWQLANGARVVVKSTDFRNDQVLLQRLQPRGALAGPRPRLPLGPLRRRSGQRQRGGALRADRAPQGAGRQGGRREPLHRGAGGGGEWSRLARRPRDDAAAGVPARSPLPAGDEEVFAAAREQLREQITRRLADPDTVFWDRWQVELYSQPSSPPARPTRRC